MVHGIILSLGTNTDQHVSVRYNPIQKFGPSDCIASINSLVDKMDQLIASKNAQAIEQLKAIFGLEALSDVRDFARTVAFPSASLTFNLVDIGSF